MGISWKKIPPAIWILMSGFMVWGWTLSFGFVWDDFPMIATNPSLDTWKTLLSGWVNDFWMLHEYPQTSGYWRPMATMFHVATSIIFGKSPWIFHLVNVLLHIGTTWFFYVFIRNTGWVKWTWIPVLFFLVHPLHAETVSFASAIPDLLCAFFGWAAVATWTSSSASSARKTWTVIGLLTCSFLSKESGIFFGVFVIASDYFLFRFGKNFRKPWALYLAIPFMIIMYAVMHIFVTGGTGIRQHWGESFWFHYATVCKLFGYQLFLQFVPIHSSPTREFEVVRSFTDAGFWVGACLFLGFIVSFFVLLRKKSAWAFVILFYLIFWFPISNVLPAEGLIADRYLYVTSMAIALGLGILVSKLKKNPMYLGILFVAWAGYAFHLSRPWVNQEKLWEHALQTSPKSSVAWNEWGNLQIVNQHFESAKSSYEKALELQPTYQDASFNLAVTLYSMRKYAECFETLKKHLERFPEDARGYDLLSAMYELGGDYDQAVQMNLRAIELEPHQWKYYYNLGGIYLQLKSYDRAIEQFHEALKIVQNRFEIWKNLAAAYCQNANYKECLETYRQFTLRFPERSTEVETQMKQAQQILELAGS